MNNLGEEAVTSYVEAEKKAIYKLYSLHRE